ncbi:MAG TPA: calcium-binding protein, partial [Tepidisphaeraceae bacterium]|nr:calcium-binding protein [Tepidisphaeraceae bacterium]
AIGDVVKYKPQGGGADFIGYIDMVRPGELVVRFDKTLTQPPDTAAPVFKIERGGSIKHQIDAMLADWLDPQAFSAKIPTLQSLIRDLAQKAGVDPESIPITLSGSGLDQAVTFPISFTPDQLTFSRLLDLSGSIPGINFTGSANFDVKVTPHINLTVGVRLDPSLAFEDRFFLGTDSAVSLDVTATLKPNNIAGSIGFLNIRLRQENPADAGISVSGNVALHLIDPGAVADGKVTFAEIRDGTLSSIINPTMDAYFDIDPLIVEATVGDNTLGSIRISLDGAATNPDSPGHVTGLSGPHGLSGLLGRIDVTGEENFSGFVNITPQMILDALSTLINRLTAMGAGGVFNHKLPLINRSVADLVNLGQSLSGSDALGGATLNQVLTAQGLADYLASKFPGLTPVVNLTPNDIRFTFRYQHNFDPVLVPLGFQLSDTLGLVNADANGQLSVTTGITANVKFGLTTAAGDIPIYDRVFFDTSASNEIHVDATANAGYDLDAPFDPATPGLNISLGVGPLAVQAIKARGLVELHLDVDLKDGTPSTVDPVDEGKLTLGEVAANLGSISNILGGTFGGDIQAIIPLDGDHNGTVAQNPASLSSGDALIHVAGKLANLDNVVFEAPNFHSAVGDDVRPLTDAELDPSKFKVFAHNLTGFLQSAIFSYDNLIAGLTKLLAMLETGLNSRVLSKNLPLVGGQLQKAADFINTIRTFVNNIHPADYTANGIKTLLETHLGSMLQGPVTVSETPGQQVQWNMQLRKSIPLSVPFDIGIPALGLKDLNSLLSGSLDFTFNFGFGISKNDDFYLDTTSSNEFDIALNLPNLSALNATGRFGFLDLHVVADTSKPNTLGGAHFGVDLRDPLGPNNRLTFNDLNSPGLKLADVVKGRFDSTGVDINLKADVTMPAVAHFPKLKADFHLDWAFANADPSGDARDFGGVPHVAFNNIRLDAGEFFANYVSPIVEKVQKVLAPVKPIRDMLERRLPVLSDISAARDFFGAHNGIVTLLDVAAKLGLVKREWVDAVDSVYQFQAALETFSTTGEINLGSFNLGSADPRQLSNLTTVTPNATPPVAAPVDQLGAAAKDKINQMKNVPGGGLKFPLLENPGSAIKLLLGQNADLFLFDMPPLDVHFSIDKSFPVLGPISVNLEGSLDLKADFGFGYDTQGFRDYFDHGRTDPEDLFNGFFISDTANPDGSGADVPEVTATGTIEAFGGVDIIIASVFVGGGVSATINIDLKDAPTADGKVRFKEIKDLFPTCMFDLGGDISAELTAKASIGVWPLKKTWRFNVAKVKLVDFTYTCSNEEPPDIKMVPNGVLNLDYDDGEKFVGKYTVTSSGVNDSYDETVTIQHFETTADGETVIVTGSRGQQFYGGVHSIIGHALGGKDNVIIYDDVLSQVEIDGGDGDDTIVALGGKDIVLPPGETWSVLRGGKGNDQISGGVNADWIIGGEGNDTLIGGQGNDKLEGSEGADELEGDEGDDVLDGDPTGASASQSGPDSMWGGPGNDEMWGDRGDDELSGDEGNDTVYGGLGGDFIDGGDGQDLLDGDDPVASDASSDTIEGGNDNDQIFGRAGGDQLSGGEGNDVIHGADGDDYVLGEGGIDELWGEVGNDNMDGGSGNDVVHGGVGNDAVNGGDGADQVFGESGFDQVFGGEGNDTIEGGAGTDIMNGGGGNDWVIGGTLNLATLGAELDGADWVNGDVGNDIVIGDNGIISGGVIRTTLGGGGGGDTAWGGAGNDTVLGGVGADNLAGEGGIFPPGTPGGNDVVIGDEGIVDVNSISTTSPGTGGDDTIEGGGGTDKLLGGDGADVIDGGVENDIELGDQGQITLFLGLVSNVQTTNPTLGGADVIL